MTPNDQIAGDFNPRGLGGLQSVDIAKEVAGILEANGARELERLRNRALDNNTRASQAILKFF